MTTHSEQTLENNLIAQLGSIGNKRTELPSTKQLEKALIRRTFV